MDATTIGVDIAKNVFEVGIMNGSTRDIARRRLTRRQFERFIREASPAHVVMEACGSSHHWARIAQAAGHRVSLLPPGHVRPYVLAHRKTDRTDVAGVLEAVRNPRLHAVVPKTVGQQAVQSLHRIRTQWMTSRTARINTVRGLLQEFGITIPRGARTASTTARQLIADDTSAVPGPLRTALALMLDEIQELEARIRAIERQLRELTAADAVVQRLQRIPGIGPLTATALVGTVGHIHAFQNARCFASWLGLTPREHSSGQRRRLGRISKAGDPYVRTLLTHGARSFLITARQQTRRLRPLTHFQQWALTVERRCGHNKATIAVANKLARVVWVVWGRDTEFSAEPPRRAAA